MSEHPEEPLAGVKKVGFAFSTTAWLFVRLIGVVYFLAFVSCAPQITALIGEHGLLPASRFLNVLQVDLGDAKLLFAPSVFWFNSTDYFLQTVCWGGAILSLMVVAGILAGPALLCCYLLYLSIVSVGQDFMSFQWDWLLLEAGFLALFLARWNVFDRPFSKGTGTKERGQPPALMIWAARFVIFKLMIMSGLVKLTSGDTTWSSFTALNYHYLTQPLPTPLGWFAGHLPEWFQKISVLAMFFIELIAPLGIFCGRRWRFAAAALIASLQLLIAATGNYTFFNLLTIVLCVPLLDDACVLRFLPARLKSRVQVQENSSTPMPRAKKWIFSAIAVSLLTLSATRMVGLQVPILSSLVSPFGVSNGYGLFAVMTTARNEIIIEGSDDGLSWREYELPYKPGDLRSAPPIVAPFQPRLDWQLWFASLTNYSQEPWFGHLMFRLLSGSDDVLHLFSKVPFREHPPKFVRAKLYKYEFSSLADLFKTGAWWKRTYVSDYFPTASLDGPSS